MEVAPSRARGWVSVLAIVALRDVPYWKSSPWRRIMRYLLLFAYVYLFVLVFTFLMQTRLAFPVWGFGRAVPPPPSNPYTKVELTASDGNIIHAWWVAPANWKPEDGAALFSYGNGQVLSSCYPLLVQWRDQLRVGVLGYDYPGYGSSSGTPGEQSCYAAVEAAHDHLTQTLKVRRQEVVLLGLSMGSAMATEMASRHGGRALILMSGFTSFPEVAQDRYPFLPARWLSWFRFDNCSKLRDLNCPVFIAHGTADGVVPYRHAKRNYAAAKEPKRLFRMEDFPHAHPETGEFFNAVREFLAESQAREKSLGKEP